MLNRKQMGWFGVWGLVLAWSLVKLQQRSPIFMVLTLVWFTSAAWGLLEPVAKSKKTMILNPSMEWLYIATAASFFPLFGLLLLGAPCQWWQGYQLDQQCNLNWHEEDINAYWCFSVLFGIISLTAVRYFTLDAHMYRLRTLISTLPQSRMRKLLQFYASKNTALANVGPSQLNSAATSAAAASATPLLPPTTNTKEGEELTLPVANTTTPTAATLVSLAANPPSAPANPPQKVDTKEMLETGLISTPPSHDNAFGQKLADAMSPPYEMFPVGSVFQTLKFDYKTVTFMLNSIQHLLESSHDLAWNDLAYHRSEWIKIRDEYQPYHASMALALRALKTDKDYKDFSAQSHVCQHQQVGGGNVPLSEEDEAEYQAVFVLLQSKEVFSGILSFFQ